jgi:hypothetical protein
VTRGEREKVERKGLVGGTRVAATQGGGVVKAGLVGWKCRRVGEVGC